MRAYDVKKALQEYATTERAKINAWFFKTGKGQYGEGDEFIGVKVPHIRLVAKRYKNTPFSELEVLLASPKHEHRLTALIILGEQFAKSTEIQKKKIVHFYLQNISSVNNWDLVDLSASQILGTYYFHYGGEKKLTTLGKSKNLWHRRIGIVSTFAYIKHGSFSRTIHIAEMLLHDKEDLIHKAVGWMLREVGKRDVSVLRDFLTKHAHEMPRTMLRYAIEKFPEHERIAWLQKGFEKRGGGVR